ncbi:ribonuclease H, putative [Eimeria tenella]|uniref:ribonuclease H n=1 Tax=Eimeria tenella TaxID=5802 RepID=U6KPA6_EIMTE|nr:ribonuclease H, putative [Eimeria tenella]CDJ37288.1 ribonuclease H, putative [Eimeria tenella]|eukprot:XP_013228126.1 ribonuclease H, putative [Eimeria tenella]
MKPDVVEIYADGACPSNGRVDARAGIGVFFGTDDRRNLSMPLVVGPQTNQRAELASILAALLRFVDYDDDSAKQQPSGRSEVRLVVISDSSYAVNCLGPWAARWCRNGWKSTSGKPVKNADLIQAILLLCDKRRKTAPSGATWRGSVEYEYIRGHSGVYGNEMADKLAVQGANSAWPAHSLASGAGFTQGPEEAEGVLETFTDILRRVR